MEKHPPRSQTQKDQEVLNDQLASIEEATVRHHQVRPWTGRRDWEMAGVLVQDSGVFSKDGGEHGLRIFLLVGLG